MEIQESDMMQFLPITSSEMCGNNLGYNFYAHFYGSLWVQKEAEVVRAIIWGMATIWDKVSRIMKIGKSNLPVPIHHFC